MKKNLIILANVLIVLSILVFVLLYTGSEARKALAAQVDPARTVVEMEAPLLDVAIVQTRNAAWSVATGEMTIDKAVAGYGTLEG